MRTEVLTTNLSGERTAKGVLGQAEELQIAEGVNAFVHVAGPLVPTAALLSACTSARRRRDVAIKSCHVVRKGQSG